MSGAHFANEQFQQKVDAISARTQGRPKPLGHCRQSKLRDERHIQSHQRSYFLSPIAIPDSWHPSNLTGTYSLDGNHFDFHGKARLDAKLSQMVTGWKSILLKPVDPFFRKNGAGTEIPVKVSGTKSEPHFGVDFGHKDNAEHTQKN